jgi:hypothetical protein
MKPWLLMSLSFDRLVTRTDFRRAQKFATVTPGIKDRVLKGQKQLMAVPVGCHFQHIFTFKIIPSGSPDSAGG